MRLLFEGKVLSPLLNPEERSQSDEQARLEILAKAKKIADGIIMKPIAATAKAKNAFSTDSH